MSKSLPKRIKKSFIVIIKLSIIIGASYFIYNKLIKNEDLDFSKFVSFLVKNDSFSLKNILFLLLLTLFNWFFEILKWQKLVKTTYPISFKAALEQSLGGLTASLITPNRIGDYGAKAIYYTKSLRKSIILLNLIGNMSQMTVTAFVGSIGLILFATGHHVDIDLYKIALLLFILLLISLFVVFRWRQKQFKVKGYTINRVLAFFKRLPKKTIRTVIGLSFIRYLIFSFQFFVLLCIFGAELNYFTAMTAISSMYLLASIAPSLATFDVVIKTSAALYFFGFLNIDELTILSTSTVMWLLNYIFPSLFGGYFVLNFNIPKTDH